MNIWSKLVAVVALSTAIGGTQAQAGHFRHGLHGLKGKIVSVAADGSSITIQHSKKSGSPMTVQVAPNTLVTIDGVGGKKVTDLEPGEMVVVSPTSGVATSIIAKHSHQKKTANN